MQEIDHLSVACDWVSQLFAKDFRRMDFIFVNRQRTAKYVINVVRSLPNLLLKVTDEHSPDISFESTWSTERKHHVQSSQTEGWDLDRIWNDRRTYLAHSYAAARRVREVAIFEYGFEVRTADNIDIHGIKASCLSDPSSAYLQSICGEPFKGIKFAPSVNRYCLKSWRHKGDVFMDKIRKQLKQEEDAAFPSMGQANRRLLLEPGEF